MTAIEAQVLVVGGGATGAGVVCDAALRGPRVVLVQRRDLAEGTTGPPRPSTRSSCCTRA